MCDEVGNLRTAFAQKADGSYFAVTVSLQGGSIGLSCRRPPRTKNNVSIHPTPTEERVRITSVDDVMVFIIYH